MIYPRVLMYVDTKRGYFARYVDRTRTHVFDLGEGAKMDPYLLEVLRTTPDKWTPRKANGQT